MRRRSGALCALAAALALTKAMASSELDDAAVAFLMAIARLPHAEQREYVRLLYGDPVQASDPITSRSRDSASGSASIPAGSLRGLIHNHPARRDLRRDRGVKPGEFSEGDIDLAEKYGVPSYILDMGTGDVRRYDPGDRSAIAGTPVLAQFPIEELRAHLMSELMGREPDDPRGLMRSWEAFLDADEQTVSAEQPRGLLNGAKQ